MKLRAEIAAKEQLSAALSISAFEYIYAPMELLCAKTKEKHRIIAVPPVFNTQLTDLKAQGFKGALAHTLGHIELIKSAGLNVHGGFCLNITNSLAQKNYEELGLIDSIFSVELSCKSMQKLEHKIPAGIITYGHMPLMLTRRCPVNDNKHCGKSGCSALTDRLGVKFKTACRFGESEILNPVPLFLEEAPADFAVLRFTTGEKVTANPKPKNFTRGMYNRRAK
jgi:putative protease